MAGKINSFGESLKSMHLHCLKSMHPHRLKSMPSHQNPKNQKSAQSTAVMIFLVLTHFFSAVLSQSTFETSVSINLQSSKAYKRMRRSPFAIIRQSSRGVTFSFGKSLHFQSETSQTVVPLEYFSSRSFLSRESKVQRQNSPLKKEN